MEKLRGVGRGEGKTFQLKILGGPSKRNKFPKVITSSQALSRCVNFMLF